MCAEVEAMGVWRASPYDGGGEGSAMTAASACARSFLVVMSRDRWDGW